jgi:hypothetical protein
LEQFPSCAPYLFGLFFEFGGRLLIFRRFHTPSALLLDLVRLNLSLVWFLLSSVCFPFFDWQIFSKQEFMKIFDIEKILFLKLIFHQSILVSPIEDVAKQLVEHSPRKHDK